MSYQLNEAKNYIHKAKLSASAIMENAMSILDVVEGVKSIIHDCDQAIYRISKHEEGSST